MNRNMRMVQVHYRITFDTDRDIWQIDKAVQALTTLIRRIDPGLQVVREVYSVEPATEATEATDMTELETELREGL